MAKRLEVCLYPIRGPPASKKERLARWSNPVSQAADCGTVAERFNAPDL